jgi:hypothetical protein
MINKLRELLNDINCGDCICVTVEAALEYLDQIEMDFNRLTQDYEEERAGRWVQ